MQHFMTYERDDRKIFWGTSDCGEERRASRRRLIRLNGIDGADTVGAVYCLSGNSLAAKGFIIFLMLMRNELGLKLKCGTKSSNNMNFIRQPQRLFK